MSFSSVSKIEKNISQINKDLESNTTSNIQDPRKCRKAVRPLLNHEPIPYVKPDPDERAEDGESQSSGRSSVSTGVPLGAKVLKKMVEDKEVEICFCDIGKQLRFGFRNGGAAVYVYPETKYPLENLVVSASNNSFYIFDILGRRDRFLICRSKKVRH